jgi:hypothetical protein
MQISRRILMGCVTALALLPLSGRAQDSDVQAKARQALEKQLTNPTPQPPAKAPAKPAPAQPATPAATAAAAPVAAAASTNAAENALHQTMADLNAQPTNQNAGPWAVAVPPPADSEEITKARDAMRQKISDLKTQTDATTANLSPRDAAIMSAVQQAQERQHQADAERKAAEPSAPPAMTDLSAPVPPISAVKQQKLDTLLQQYEADQISPTQYHEERAKILAGK